MTNDTTFGFQRGLNQHGYAFQHRVIREAAQISDQHKSAWCWNLLGVEQPIVINGKTTKIDFILYVKQGANCWLLVAECKRVNPAFSNWCFAKGAYQRPQWVGTQELFEVLSIRSAPRSGAAGGDFQENIFDIGFTLKTNNRGDEHPVGSDHDSLEQACTQALLGVNGLIKLLTTERRFAESMEGVDTFTFVPVVFTTAELHTSDVDLRNTELKSGEVLLSNPPTKADWLYYQYPQSPIIKHEVTPAGSPWENRQDSWSEIVARDFWRTVTVVTAEGTRAFLSRKPPGYLDSSAA